MKNKLLILFSMLVVTFLSGCDKDLDSRTTLTFIGDSLIARWDLQASFSSMITCNLGVSGSGIDYIESKAGTLSGKNVVVMSGTNNSYLMAENSCGEFAARYVTAIKALGAKTIYLYEVLPREFAGDPKQINEDIRRFNAAVASLVAEDTQIEYIKCYDIFSEGENGICAEYYSDGLHLSPYGYEILARLLNQYL